MRPINATLYVDNFVGGSPGEYTFANAVFENQSDATGNGAYDVQVGFLLYVPATDLALGTPIPGIIHRYKFTTVTPVDNYTLSGTILWDELGTEDDSPTNGSYSLLCQPSTKLKYGLLPSDSVYTNLPPGSTVDSMLLDTNDIADETLPLTGGTITGNVEITGTFQHGGGLILSAGTAIDQVAIFTKALTLTTDWSDVGINNTDLETGTYVIQLYANDLSSGGTNNNEYYSGTMSWYSGSTNSALALPTDEIALHRAGASGEGSLYLRTYRTETADPLHLKLQMYSNTPTDSDSNYVFKFRRLV